MKKAVIALIKIYRNRLSGLLPSRCRFYPTCSEYAINAIEKRGLFFGFFLIVKRLIRCNPYFPCGYDPVK